MSRREGGQEHFVARGFQRYQRQKARDERIPRKPHDGPQETEVRIHDEEELPSFDDEGISPDGHG